MVDEFIGCYVIEIYGFDGNSQESGQLTKLIMALKKQVPKTMPSSKSPKKSPKKLTLLDLIDIDQLVNEHAEVVNISSKGMNVKHHFELVIKLSWNEFI